MPYHSDTVNKDSAMRRPAASREQARPGSFVTSWHEDSEINNWARQISGAPELSAVGLGWYNRAGARYAI